MTRPSMAVPGRMPRASGRQIEVLAGNHLVGAKSGAVIVVAHRGKDVLTHESATTKTWIALRDMIMAATAKDSEQFGRVFGRLAAKWAGDQPDDVEFGVLSPAKGGYAVFLKGAVLALVEKEGKTESMRGTDSATFADVILPIENRAALLVISDNSPIEFPPERGFGSMDEGIAQGAGAVLWLTDATVAAAEPPPVDQPSDVGLIKEDRLVATEERSAPIKKVELKTPKTFELFKETDEPPPPREPLPIGEPEPIWESDPEPTQLAQRPAAPPRHKPTFVNPVRGVICRRDHLNDPRNAFCRVCGLRMNETKIIVEGERPPLGFLVLDDGHTFTMDADYVIGREPENTPSVQNGAMPVRLIDNGGQLSRAHAEFRLIEWDVAVVDLGSRNGTFVKPPGHPQWSRLTPWQPYQLASGAEIQIASRRLTFEAPHARL